MTGAMLRLARAVYGCRATVNIDQQESGAIGHVYIRGEYNFPYPTKNSEPFDPANNSEQFVEVLAWLLRQDQCLSIDRYLVEMAHGDTAMCCVESRHKHNGTPAGIRAAVVEAAVRVAK